MSGAVGSAIERFGFLVLLVALVPTFWVYVRWGNGAELGLLCVVGYGLRKRWHADPNDKAPFYRQDDFWLIFGIGALLLVAKWIVLMMLF